MYIYPINIYILSNMTAILIIMKINEKKEITKQIYVEYIIYNIKMDKCHLHI